MIPITRIDEYLAVISQDEDATGLPDQAVTRIDTYLSKIAGEAVAELPEPVTRIDRYLASIAGMDVVMYNPITRIDYYLAAVAGVYSGELPEPVTRIDHYLYNWAEGGSLPWQTFVGNPLQFNAPKAHTLRSTVVAFSPIQSGSGDPSPDNVRPISGWTGATVWGAGENLWGGTLNDYYPVKLSVGETLFLQAELDDTSKYLVIRTYDKDKNFLQSAITGTVSGSITYGYITANKAASYFRVEKGSSASHSNGFVTVGATTVQSYAPPTISTTTLTFGSTVYGGQASMAEDWTGTGSGTMGRLVIDSTNYDKLEEYTSGDILGWSISFANAGITFENNSLPVCNMLKGTTWAENGACRVNFNRIYLFIRSEYPTLADVLALVQNTPIEVVALLATPVPFTPTVTGQPTAVQGINTMWTDGDNLTVEARAEAVNLSALQSLNMLLGGRYVNNRTEEDLTDEETLDVLLGNR